MKLFTLLELCTYLALLPVVFKVISAIELSRFFKRYHVLEIRIFYLLMTIVITKILGDFLITIMDYTRLLLDITA